MGKRKIDFIIESFGLYSKWDRNSKELPKIIEFITQIPAKVDAEFGYILHIKGGKGEKIEFIISHPQFKDINGNIAKPFTGEVYINTNDYRVYLGDCIWEPVNDKKGEWKIEVFYKNELISSKTFIII
ncbi:DUF3859 domain-containing protein [Bacteroidota bacterium]